MGVRVFTSTRRSRSATSLAPRSVREIWSSARAGAAAGDDDLSAFQVNLLAFLSDGLDQLNADLISGEDKINLLHLSGAGVISLQLLIHARTAGADLGESEGAQNGGHQVAAERGTGPSNLAGGLVDVQRSTVSGQTGLQTTSHTGAQVTAQGGCTHQNGGGAVRLNAVYDSGGVSVGAVVAIHLVVYQKNLVSTVCNGFLHSVLAVVADDQSNRLAALDASQATAGIQQLQADISCLTIFGFNKDPYILGLCFIASL